MPINTDSNSRFKFSESVIIDGKETFGMWKRPNFMKIENVPDTEVTYLAIDQSTAGRPDLISGLMYGTPLLEWVVIMFNKPLNPIGWPKAGTVIQLPSTSVVRNGL
jgi:hypothetical protein